MSTELDYDGGGVMYFYSCTFSSFNTAKQMFHNVLIMQRDHLLPEEEADLVGGGGGLEPQLVLIWLIFFFC